MQIADGLPRIPLSGLRAAVALAAILLVWTDTCRAQSPALRMEPGIIFVSAIHDSVQDKDYEQISEVLAVDAKGVRFRSSWTIPDKSAPDGVRIFAHEELALAQDMQSARRLVLWYLNGDPETMPGSTNATPSQAVFDDVKAHGKADVIIGAVSDSDGGALGGLMAGRKYFRGNVRFLGHQPVRVLVDGAPTMLDTLHVGGEVAVAGDQANVEFYWLDNRDLRWSLSQTFQGSKVQVVRIDRPRARAGPGSSADGGSAGTDRLQHELAGKACRSEVPGVYFLTDSAQLLPASHSAIEAIAAMLKAQPTWTVTIEGHTDATGGDAHNLALSRSRADAMKKELVDHYGIPAARLTTAGFGRTRPVDDNRTLEGRAHNRRVELVRRC